LEADSAAGDSGDAVSGDENAGEVERVGGGYRDRGFVGAGGLLGAGFAEAVRSFGESILLAEGSGDEAAAADLASGFEAAEDGEQVAPLGGVGFAGEEFAEEDAVTAEQDAGVRVYGCVGLFGCGDGGGGRSLGLLQIPRLRSETWGTRRDGEKRPAAGGGAGGGSFAEAGGRGGCGGGFAAGVHHGAELVEAVGGGKAGGG
jgi:hypothetical protein